MNNQYPKAEAYSIFIFSDIDLVIETMALILSVNGIKHNEIARNPISITSTFLKRNL